MSKPFPSLGPEYEQFLYGVVCTEENGMQLTMASVIARSGMDPWQEAARLSKLPEVQARQVLSSLILAQASQQLPSTIERFLSLLPKPKRAFSPSKKDLSGGTLPIVCVFAFTATLMLTCLFASASHTRTGVPLVARTAQVYSFPLI